MNEPVPTSVPTPGENFTRTAEHFLRILLNHPVAGKILKEKKKLGGVLSVASLVGQTRMTSVIGIMAPDRENICREFAKEKALRLGSFPKHRTSYESRAPEHDQFGGAVRCHSVILSFSGLPEELDEVFVVAIAIHHGELTMEEGLLILSSHPNKYNCLMEDLFE